MTRVLLSSGCRLSHQTWKCNLEIFSYDKSKFRTGPLSGTKFIQCVIAHCSNNSTLIANSSNAAMWQSGIGMRDNPWCKFSSASKLHKASWITYSESFFPMYLRSGTHHGFQLRTFPTQPERVHDLCRSHKHPWKFLKIGNALPILSGAFLVPTEAVHRLYRPQKHSRYCHN